MLFSIANEKQMLAGEDASRKGIVQRKSFLVFMLRKIKNPRTAVRGLRAFPEVGGGDHLRRQAVDLAFGAFYGLVIVVALAQHRRFDDLVRLGLVRLRGVATLELC